MTELKNIYAEIAISHGGKLMKIELDGLQGSMIHDHINQLLNKGQKVALVDIDGTLRDSRGRIPLLPTAAQLEEFKDEPNLAYEDFHLACGQDLPMIEQIKYVQGLKAAGYFIVLLTSCTAYPETIEATLNQMLDGRVGHDTMVMRHPDNHYEPTEMKMNFINELVEDTNTLQNILIMDDNKETIDAAKDLGLQTHLVPRL